jgi:TPR repeat protein
MLILIIYISYRCSIALCYENGTGVTKTPAEAVRLFTLAAGQGKVNAQYKVGERRCCVISFMFGCSLTVRGCAGSYFQRGVEVAKNMTEAARYFTLAANQGYAPAQTMLGTRCQNDLLVILC